jgi:hypothetical protein
MSNVFTYPNNAGTNYINPTDPILLGAMERANTFLNGGNSASIPYATAYAGNNTRMSGLSPRTPENLLSMISYNRSFYGVASGSGQSGFPNYYSVYNMPNLYAYFHVIKFGFDTATTNPTDGTLRLGCIRNSSTHTGLPITVASTQTHGMGNASLKYTDTYDRQFDFSGFTGGYAALNGNTYYVKVVDGRYLDVYTNAAGTNIVNPSGFGAYNGDGFAVIDQPSNGPYQLVGVTYRDQSNARYYYYDKDHYSGAGNEVGFQFGAYKVGARAQFFVKSGQQNTSSFSSNTPIDHGSVAEWWYDSDFYPRVTITCNGDGQVYNGSNGYVTGVSFDPEFCGLMDGGGTNSLPTLYGAECLILPDNYDSDPLAGYNFAISNITQANPGVITFTNSVFTQTGGLKTITGVSGMTQINGKAIYLKSISHNQAQIYTNSALTTTLDTTGYTAYTSGGSLSDYDDNYFGYVSVFNNGNWSGRNPTTLGAGNFAPGPLDLNATGSIDQVWPNVVKPAKIDWRLIQPTRKTYGQDLTRYTNSTSAYGYRLTLQYNNISKANWRVFDGFIKSMRGASAPFMFYASTADMGYNVFETDPDTVTTWTNTVRTATTNSAGDSMVYFFGFAPNITICEANDVFFSTHTYRNNFTYNNVGFAGGSFGSNAFGEAIIRFTHPLKNSIAALRTDIQPTSLWSGLNCMLSADEVEYDWHPTGKFVSFEVSLDLI